MAVVTLGRPLGGSRAVAKANTSSVSGDVMKKKGLKMSVVQVRKRKRTRKMQ